MISAKVVADSKNEFGNRITTMVITMPRFILAEFNTHRMFSRNSASSRAIPFKRLIQSIEDNPFIPIAWQKDHTGMQGTDYFGEEHSKMLNQVWLSARDEAVAKAEALHFGIGTIHEDKTETNISVTKQMCNRLLEAFMYHTVIVTATEWENFFAMRCPQYQFASIPGRENPPIYRSKKDLFIENAKYHPELDIDKALEDYSKSDSLFWLRLNKGQAEIHMMALAEAMWDAYNESTPKEMKAGDWHVPFNEDIDVNKLYKLIDPNNELDVSVRTLIELSRELSVKISTARCARVSYTVVGDGEKLHDYESDVKLHDRLSKAGHWSPFEHCAKAMEGYIPESIAEYPMSYTPVKAAHYGNEWSGNFKGWIQYRKTFNGENRC